MSGAGAPARNDGAADDAGDGLDRLEITVEAMGNPASITSAPRRSIWLRETQLLLMVHAAAWRLFSVAQSGIENSNSDWLHRHESSPR